MHRFKFFFLFPMLLLIFSCKQEHKRNKVSRHVIEGDVKQDSIFAKLMNITGGAIPEAVRGDSLAFLILPVEASCPYCRRRAIDSVIKYKNSLGRRNFIIISGKRYGRIDFFFKEQGEAVPLNINEIFIDSANRAFMENLVWTNPAIYYTSNNKAYLKMSCIPSTIGRDLKDFFSFIESDIK